MTPYMWSPLLYYPLLPLLCPHSDLNKFQDHPQCTKWYHELKALDKMLYNSEITPLLQENYSDCIDLNLPQHQSHLDHQTALLAP